MELISQYLAKSDGCSLIQHSQDVVDAGRKILEVLVVDDKEYWKPKLDRTAILHDFGKIHDDFQEKLLPNSTNKVRIRHELISIIHCMNITIEEIFAIATHHKGIFGEGNKHLQKNLIVINKALNEESKDRMNLNYQEWVKHFKLKFEEVEVEEKALLNTLYSNRQKYLTYNERLNLALMRALLISADHLASAGMQNDIPYPQQITMESFHPCKINNDLKFRSFQTKMTSIKGNALLHAPTGSGKTEAAMCWVTANQSERSRLFYLLPYTASANAMLSRLSDIYGDTQTTVLHSRTIDFFFDELTEDNIIDAQKNAKSKKQLSKEIFYPVKVTTPHQIVKNATLSKGWEMCLWEYRNALFIIDEFHTYNALLTGLILATVKWLKREFGAKVLFMSATIPNFMQDLILEHILEGDVSKIVKPNKHDPSDQVILDRKRHRLNFQDTGTISDNVKEIEQLLLEGRKVLIIVNNVKTAQNIFKAIQTKTKRALLHSGFNKRDRIKIEKSITSKKENDIPLLLVATQAVEVSLDIDYDCAYIENAPIDALIQRLGRINRSGKKQIAPVRIVKENEGKTPFYDEAICNKTWDELKKLEGIPLSEDDLINTCNSVYCDGYNSIQLKDFNQGLNNDTINNFRSNMIAGDWCDIFENVFKNNDQKIEILCENLIDEYSDLLIQKRFIEANQLLVSIYYYQLGKNNVPDKTLNVIIGYDFYYDPIVGYRKKTLVEDQML